MDPVITKKSEHLTLQDRLSRLTFTQACKLLGPEGKQLIRAGERWEIDVENEVQLDKKLLRVKFPLDDAVVTIALKDEARDRLQWNCTKCFTACDHAGAVFATLLEKKMALGLAAPPSERAPVESLSESELVSQAVEERQERAKKERMRLKSTDPAVPWTDYTITSAASGKTYYLSLRGEERGKSFCSCPDFRSNTLGTCKHIMHAVEKVRRKFPASKRNEPFRLDRVEVSLQYADELTLCLGAPDDLNGEAAKVVKPLKDRPIDDVHQLIKCLTKLERLEQEPFIYPDAEEYIQHRLFQDRISDLVEEIRQDPEAHPLRKELLKTELLPYQLDGVAFAVGAGRAILADDMGLGKTIQGVGVAEILARQAGIEKVLVICPTSLKSQWRNEIHRFSDRDCQLVVGTAEQRAEQYDNDRFFTICNYEQVLRDVMPIEEVDWDLIILDEGQRIKNWEAKTSKVVKALSSPFALVLSGTPLENRLDELYSVVQFVDDRRLAPAFRFFNRHRVVDERGKVLGYKNLAQLRENLAPILLRRTRDMVMKDLPPRTNEIVRIPPTDEQAGLHASHMQIVASITNRKYLTEMDLLRLQKALLMCRMSANSTFLVDKQPPGYSSKLERLEELLGQLQEESERKVVLFSEWTTMLNLIEPVLDKLEMDYVRLDGSVPQKQRQKLVHQFQNDANCKLFITTNAGSTGLNLQAANTVINVDLPWNPAVLEQRIARAHRMGQKRPVQVYVLVTEGTLEENLLATLGAKHDLALAALDVESDVDEVDLASGMEELKRRLEMLLGARPEAPKDESQRLKQESEAQRAARREKVSAAGGQLLSAAFGFLKELLPEQEQTEASRSMSSALRESLADCIERDEESGVSKLTVTLPDESALDQLAESLSRLLAARGK